MRDVFERALSEGGRLLASCLSDKGFLDAVQRAGEQVSTTLKAGGKVMACGNGGSLCDAAHFAEEFSGRFRNNRRPLPAMAFTDAAHMSCVANDFGFDEVFSRMVEAFGRPGDSLLLLSTSGNSTNLIQAANAAKESCVTVIGFLGRGGGKLASLCDISVLAPGATSDRIQEVHMLALHALIEAVEQELGFG